MGPAGFARQQSHGLAPAGFVRQQSGVRQQQVDWRTYLTIEERQAVRQKIRFAYSKNCESYTQLLQTCQAVPVFPPGKSPAWVYALGCLKMNLVSENLILVMKFFPKNRRQEMRMVLLQHSRTAHNHVHMQVTPWI